MKLARRDEPTCWRCGFRPLVNAQDELLHVDVTVDGTEWPGIWLCEDCADEIAVDLGARHLLKEVIEP